jgi:hypothetical protein
MFMHTDTIHAPWYVVNADVKERARLNCISHILQKILYHSIKLPEIKFGRRKKIPSSYVRPPMSTQHIVPDFF